MTTSKGPWNSGPKKWGSRYAGRSRWGPAFWLEVGPKKGQTGLALYPGSMMDNWAERKPSIVFDCADIDSMVEGLKVRGVEFTREPKAMQWGTYAVFKDVDDNEFVLRGD